MNESDKILAELAEGESKESLMYNLGISEEEAEYMLEALDRWIDYNEELMFEQYYTKGIIS